MTQPTNIATDFMYGAEIETNPTLVATLRTQGFTRDPGGLGRLWRKGPRQGRRYVAFLDPAGETLFVARPGKDDFVELDAHSPTLEADIHAFTHR